MCISVSMKKDYEQYVKLGTPLEEADIINRFEIRLRNERAYYAVRDLLTYYDAENRPHFLSSTSMCGLLMKNPTSKK